MTERLGTGTGKVRTGLKLAALTSLLLASPVGNTTFEASSQPFENTATTTEERESQRRLREVLAREALNLIVDENIRVDTRIRQTSRTDLGSVSFRVSTDGGEKLYIVRASSTDAGTPQLGIERCNSNVEVLGNHGMCPTMELGYISVRDRNLNGTSDAGSMAITDILGRPGWEYYDVDDPIRWNQDAWDGMYDIMLRDVMGHINRERRPQM